MQGAGDRPEATFVALASEQVVGYSKFALREAQPTIAYHDLCAVRRAWRGRGIARALKATQINWALANGYTELRTRNEARNAAIRHLNAAFGYRRDRPHLPGGTDLRLLISRPTRPDARRVSRSCA